MEKIALTHPHTGGSYTRHPETGDLHRSDVAAPAPEENAVAAAVQNSTAAPVKPSKRTSKR